MLKLIHMKQKAECGDIHLAEGTYQLVYDINV
jgi:hypothetical protein